MKRLQVQVLVSILGLVAAGCGASGFGGSDSATEASGGGAFATSTDAGAQNAAPGGSVGLSQAGAQDFGLFRKILEEGDIPAPSTIDDLGFFAEHKLDFPEADCGEDVCVHASLGMMGNMINGGDCTLIQIGMNTPIDVEALERPPLHLVLAVDVSGSMAGDPITYVKVGLDRMLDHLEPEDTVSLVTYSGAADVVLDATPATELTTLKEAFAGLDAGGPTNLYAGLFEAFELAEAHLDMTRQNRVILLSDGNATEGITDPAKMASLAAANAKLGVGLTTIGLGEEFDIETMRTLAEVGAGNFYFLEDPEAVKEVFTDEVKTFMVPIATDVTIALAVGDDYALGNVYGTNGFSTTAYGGVIEIPALFLAGRTDASDPIEEGRRGGGGAILIELIPVGDIGSAEAPEVILDVDAGWTDPLSGAGLSQLVPVTEDGTPGFIPEEGYFTDFTVEKAFVMLNLYVGFLIAAELAEDADLPAARGVLEALQEAAGEWVADHADPDIEDDLTYVDLFIDNLLEAEAQMGVQLPPPLVQPDPWPAGD